MSKYLLNHKQFARKNTGGGGVFKSPRAPPPPGRNFRLNSSPTPTRGQRRARRAKGGHAARDYFLPLPPAAPLLLNNVNGAQNTIGAQEAGSARRLTMAAAATRHLVAGPGPSHSFGAGAGGAGTPARPCRPVPPGPRPAPPAPHPARGKRQRARGGAASHFSLKTKTAEKRTARASRHGSLCLPAFNAPRIVSGARPRPRLSFLISRSPFLHRVATKH